MTELNDAAILVVGATGGLGRAISRGLADDALGGPGLAQVGHDG